MIYRQKAKKPPPPPKNGKAAPKPKINMKERVRGFVFFLFWYLSILAGFFLLICPILPLVIISPKRYRRWSDVIFGIWESFPVAMMEIWFGTRIILSGDKINPYENSLVIINHRTRVDWNFLWLGLFHSCQPKAHNMKYVLKAPIMHIPGPGWVMQTSSFIFINRNWEKDKQLLNNMLDYLNESDDLYQILLFPEGTDLSESNIEKSHKFADENNLQRYYKVLHPKTQGFAFLANKMKSGGQLKAIYDLTIAYPKTIPQNESDLFRGKFPEEVHLHIKRYSSSSIPHQENDLKFWLKNLWRQKESKLENFYSTGFFGNNEQDDDFKKYANEKIDFGKLSMKNGTIKYRYTDDEDPIPKEISLERILPIAGTSVPPPKPIDTLRLTDVRVFARTHIDCGGPNRPIYNRPSDLLYLALLFWMSLITVAIYELFNNFYVQMWVLTHSLLFTVLSFVSNGFNQIAASIYFYRYGRKSGVMKKFG